MRYHLIFLESSNYSDREIRLDGSLTQKTIFNLFDSKYPRSRDKIINNL